MDNVFNVRRPNFIIFTDKDGTLDLEDRKLNNIFNLIISMNGMVIPITGRTVGDILESLKNNDLKIPEIVVGDNGANVYSTSQNKFLIRKCLDIEKIKEAIEKFYELGGKEENIRLTDGANIYAIDNPDVKNYYKKSNSVKYFESIDMALENMPEITKLTLAGTKEQMQQMAEYSDILDFWTDMGSTKFPVRDQKNYRLDMADKNINKGEAVRMITSVLKPQYGYICIGNGENDIPMFKQAIDDNMFVGVMGESPEHVKNEINDYANNANKGKVKVIPKDKNRANRYMQIFAKLFEQYSKESHKNMINKKSRKNFVDSLKFSPSTLDSNQQKISTYRKIPPHHSNR